MESYRKASVLTDGGTSKFEGTNNFAKLSFTSIAKVYHGSGTPGLEITLQT